MYLFESGSKSNWNVMRMGDDLTSVFKWLRMILLRCFILLLKNLDLKLKSMVVFFSRDEKKTIILAENCVQILRRKQNSTNYIYNVTRKYDSIMDTQ